MEAAGVIFSELEKTLNQSRGRLVQCQTLVEIQQAVETDPQDKFVDVMSPFTGVAEKKLHQITDSFTNMKTRFEKLFNRFGGDFSGIKDEKEIAEFWTNLWNFSLAIENAKKKNEQLAVLAEKAAIKQAKAAAKAAKRQAKEARANQEMAVNAAAADASAVESPKESGASTFQQFASARRGMTAKDILRSKRANRMSVRGGDLGGSLASAAASQVGREKTRGRRGMRRQVKNKE